MIFSRLDLDALQEHLAATPLQDWVSDLPRQLQAKLDVGHGDLARWFAAVEALPELEVSHFEQQHSVSVHGTYDETSQTQLKSALQGLIPWRKGPFELFDLTIETEWRSDWKWHRLAPHLDLTDKRILDVGCGNGYYMWRMLGAGARCVLGIDPNWLFLNQFLALKNYQRTAPIWHLPLALEELPAKLEGFDAVFSMGVLYHRRSPIEHLLELKDCLKPGGELVLETLVIEGDSQQVLVPEDRYAQMRNVWFLPSVEALKLWLRRAGFSDIRCVDVSKTSVHEQRSTEWMRYQSLPDFLDPHDSCRTIEGYPAPTRAVLLAQKPA